MWVMGPAAPTMEMSGTFTTTATGRAAHASLDFRRLTIAGVPLDKSEGPVKDKKSLAMRQHRDSRQRR